MWHGGNMTRAQGTKMKRISRLAAGIILLFTMLAPAAQATDHEVPPENDDRADAVPLSSDTGEEFGNNENATLESRELKTFDTGYHSVWYTWSTNTTQDMVFATCTGSTFFDTRLHVATAKKVIASNDDGDGCGGGSEVYFAAQAGVTYWIRVSSYAEDDTDDFHLTWEPTCARFDVVEVALSWNDARAAANEQGLQLATIGSQWEQDCVGELDPIEFETAGLVWLGGADLRREGTWQWYEYKPDRGSTSYKTFWKGDGDGAAFRGAYENWNAGEPNDAGDPGEDCLELNSDGLAWNDASCASLRYYVTEIPGDLAALN
jgi:hypothetical protein